MPVRDEGEACFRQWVKLIKADKISEVLTEVEKKSLVGEKALECVICISQRAYNDAQNDTPFNSPPEDIVRLTEVLCSLVTSQVSLCNLRFITSLYHIAYFFSKRNHLVYVKRIFKIVLETKQANINTFQSDGRKIYDYFILLLKKVIPKIVSSEDVTKVQESFSLFLEMLVVENSIENGSAFLGTVLYASQVVATQNKTLAGILICKGLQLFSEVDNIKDIDSSLSFIFKLFSSLFHYQLDLRGYASALGGVLSYVDTYKWKFCKESVLHGECFYLLSKAKMFQSSPSKKPASETIQNVNLILEKFQKMKQKKDFVKEACLLMIYIVSNLHESKTINSSDLLGVFLGPFLEMLLNLYSVLVDFNMDKMYSVQCMSNCFLLISKEKQVNQIVLKECLDVILRTATHLLEENGKMRFGSHSKADWYTKLVLTRYANLVHFYHLASLNEEIVAISKPLCKFICTLPPHIMDDTQNKISVDVSFTCLINALGPSQLYEMLEVAVAWLLVCPQSSDKVFRLWGDMKHNAICTGNRKFLDTTIFTIVTEGKSSLEEKWLPCNLTTAQIGNFLVKELNTYCVNSTLRGSPVLQAFKALESLATDVLTQVRGVVVALDVTSARSEYAEQCRHFYSLSKQLLATLRKQKNQIDPVEFNCIMGELLFAHFRFKLQSFRSDCEGEVVRLSALNQTTKPLVSELPENRPDPDDTCDVATRYANLSLDKQQEVLADMDSAVAHWKVACTRWTQYAGLKTTKYDLRITMKNVEEAAFIMKLHCDEIKEGELWRLLYKFALLADFEDKVVLAVGEMLEGKDVDLAVLDKADYLLSQAKLPEKTKHAYLFNKALSHLRKNEIDESVKILKEKAGVRKSLSTNLYINFLVTLGIHQKWRNWMMYNEPFLFSPSCHFSFHKAFTLLLYLSQQEKWNSLAEASYIHLNLLQMSHELGDINWSLEQPREARSYLRSQFSLAQKLGLPLRTAQLLLLLAWVDLNTGVMDDCKVKIEGLEALLNLQGTPARAYNGGADSPTGLSKREVCDPVFLDHFAGCDCFVCRCIEYQRLVLETLTLRATFCATNNQVAAALQNFKVALRVEAHLSKSDVIQVQTSCARMWKHYTDALVLSDTLQEKTNVKKKALDALLSTREPQTVLQHILYQRTCLQNLNTSHNKPVKHRIVIETGDIESSCKTPMKGRGEASPVPVKTPLSVYNKNITPKFVRPVRKLVLPSSGDENTPPPPKTSPKSKRKIRPLPKYTIKTPQAVNTLPKKKTPFTIVDDDGNAVSVSSSKIPLHSKTRKKIESKANNIVDPINKNLFGSKSDDLGIFGSPVRKSNRNPKGRSIEGKKVPKDHSSIKESEMTSTSQGTNKTELRADSDMFTFDELELEVNKIKSAIPKSTYSKSSSLVISKEKSARSQTEEPSVIDSDCSVVEGTPTPPEIKNKRIRNLRPRKATK